MKAIPLIGAAISGAVEFFVAEQVAKRAKATFVPVRSKPSYRSASSLMSN